MVLTASRAGEVSEERDDLGHGVFTYYLLEGLNAKADVDGDNLVTVDEAYLISPLMFLGPPAKTSIRSKKAK